MTPTADGPKRSLLRGARLDRGIRPVPGLAVDEQVQTATLPDRANMGRTADRRQEGRERILAPNRVPGAPQEPVPLLVMDRLAPGVVGSEYLNRDLLQALAAQTLIELVEADLRVEPQNLGKPDESLLVVVCLGPRVVSQGLQSLGPLALLGDALCQRSVLGSHRIVELSCVVTREAHSTPDRKAPPG